MNENNEVLSRQSALIAITIFLGLFIIMSYYDNDDQYLINFMLVIYSTGIPMMLLFSNGLGDLNNNYIFIIWLIIGLIHFIFYLFTRDNTDFAVYRHHRNLSNFEIKYAATNITSSLKGLLIFLIVYKILNETMKKITDNHLISTYRKNIGEQDKYDRGVTNLDAFFNVLLFVSILVAAYTK